MKTNTIIAATLHLAFALVLAAQTSPLSVSKLEPPNWWAGLPAPTILFYGKGLDGAHVRLKHAPSGVRIADQHAGKDGLYYFVALQGTEAAKAGEITFEITNAAASMERTVQLESRSQPHPQPLTADDVIYLIMPDRFADGDTSNDSPPQSPGTFDRSKPRAYHGGDLRGIRQHLPYLKELGVTILWLTPIVDNDNSSPTDYHGYGAVDFYAVDEHLGSVSDLRDLATAARRQGIRIYLDEVVNHTGPRHVWAQHPPADCWLHGTPQDHPPFSDNFPALVDPHATRSEWYNTIAGWFAGILPDMDNDCPEVEQYQFQNAVWWIETAGIDGYRLDTFPYSSRSFWTKWHSDLRKVYPDVSDVGEVFNGDPVITSFFQGGRKQFDGIDSGLTTVFDFPLMFAIRDVLSKGDSARKLAAVLGRDSLYPNSGNLVTFIGNHDLNRFLSLAGSDPERLKAAAGLLVAMRGIPQLYYGDEIGMEGGNDPDNRRDFPGGFPGDLRNAFTAAERTQAQQDVFAYTKAVLALRREHPALRSGTLQHVLISDSVYAFVRTAQEDRVLAVFSNADHPQSLTFTNQSDGGLSGAIALEPLLSSSKSPAKGVGFANGSATLDVPAVSLTLYKVGPRQQ